MEIFIFTVLASKILFYFYQKAKSLLAGKGFSKYSFIREVKKYALSNLQTDYAEVFGNKLFLGKKGLAMVVSHYGVYEKAESKIMEHKIGVGDTVIDIGANIGLHTLNMARIVGNSGRVIAFEPDPTNFKILKKNVKTNNYKNIIAEQKAVGDKNERTTLYLSEHPGKHKIGHKPRQSKGQIQAELISLDNYFGCYDIDKISFIKIDVEGLELSVLKGMENILKNNKNMKILFEFMPKLNFPPEDKESKLNSNPKELLDYLTSNGFKLYCIDEKTAELFHVSNNEKIIELCSTTDNTISRNVFCEK